MVFEHILAATDFSGESTAGALVAAALAQRLGAKLSFMHVATDVPSAPEGRTSADELRLASATAELEALARLARDSFGAEPESFVVCDAVPADAIVAAAVKYAADLVCTGAHGRGGLTGLLMGSVAERVLRQAPCAVLTTRQTEAPTSASGLLGLVVCGTDFSEPSRRALATAGELARAFDAELTVAHVTDPTVPTASRGSLVSLDDREAELNRELAELCRSVLGEGGYKTRLLVGANAAATLCDYARDMGASLLVISTHGRTGLARLLIGSVAEKVVKSSSVPALTLRPPRR
ncbi:MAG: universal stress protein [Myxococcales bacterium]|nr:universal stress protein [Myxococcales bacterium]